MKECISCFNKTDLENEDKKPQCADCQNVGQTRDILCPICRKPLEDHKDYKEGDTKVTCTGKAHSFYDAIQAYNDDIKAVWRT